jgi:hypothetical protein
MSISISTSHAGGYKTCLLHNVAYKVIPSNLTCPLVGLNMSSSSYMATQKETSIINNQSIQFNNKTLQNKTVHIHHPDCYGEHDGGPE